MQQGEQAVMKINHWPNPVTWIVNIDVLVCNQDWWLAQVELADAIFLNFFWTNVVPSPRELERKALLGGYRCGFYLDIKVKSPIEVIWGEGTAKVVLRIAHPFVKFLFFWWATAATYEALSGLETVLYPQTACVPSVGKFYEADGNAPIPGGGVSGAFTFQTLKYDPYNLAIPFEMGNEYGAGDNNVYATFVFSAGLTRISNVQIGFDLDGVIVQNIGLGDCEAGQELRHALAFKWTAVANGVISPWFSADSGARLLPASASCVVYTYDGGVP